MFFLKIPILPLFFVFLVISFIEVRFASKERIRYILTKYLIFATLFYLLWHLFAFSGEIYSYSFIFGKYNSGFIASNSYTKPIGLSVIIIYIYVIFSEPNLRIKKFLIPLIGAVYSMLFISNPNGCINCFCIYNLFYTIIFCISIYNKKMVNQQIISSMLSFFFLLICVELGTLYKESNISYINQLSEIFIILSFLFQIGFTPFFRKLIYSCYFCENGIIRNLIPINILCSSILLLKMVNLTDLNIEIFIELILLFSLVSSGIFSFREVNFDKLAGYLSVFICSFIGIVIVSNVGNEEKLQSIGNLIGHFALIFTLIIFILERMKNRNSSNRGNVILISLFILSLTGIPFISVFNSYQHILLNSSLFMMFINSVYKIILFLICIKYIKYNEFIIKNNELHKENGINFRNIIFYILFISYIVFSIFDITQNKYVRYNQKNIVSYIAISYIIFQIAMHAFFSSGKNLRYISLNIQIDNFTTKLTTSVYLVYNMIILYIKNLINIFEKNNEKIKKEAKFLFLSINRNRINRIKYKNTIISVIIFIFIGIITKLLSS